MSNGENSVRTFECPSPDCSYTTGGGSELAEHVNVEHPGEYKRRDWPDTEAGRATRWRDSSEDDEE
jgi:hypothetical protein